MLWQVHRHLAAVDFEYRHPTAGVIYAALVADENHGVPSMLLVLRRLTEARYIKAMFPRAGGMMRATAKDVHDNVILGFLLAICRCLAALDITQRSLRAGGM